MIENSRSKQIRITATEILEPILQSIAWSGNTRINDSAQTLNKRAIKWTKLEDMEGISTKLYAMSLSHGPLSTLEENFDWFLEKGLFKRLHSAKSHAKKEHLIESLLILLRYIYYCIFLLNYY